MILGLFTFENGKGFSGEIFNEALLYGTSLEITDHWSDFWLDYWEKGEKARDKVCLESSTCRVLPIVNGFLRKVKNRIKRGKGGGDSCKSRGQWRGSQGRTHTSRRIQERSAPAHWWLWKNRDLEHAEGVRTLSSVHSWWQQFISNQLRLCM